MVCGMAGFATFAFAPGTAIFVIGIPLLSLWGLTSPPMQSLMSRRVGVSEQGQLQGALMSLFGVAGMIAPLVFTQVFAVAISPRWGLHFPGAPYWLAAGLMVGSFAIAWALRAGEWGRWLRFRLRSEAEREKLNTEDSELGAQSSQRMSLSAAFFSDAETRRSWLTRTARNGCAAGVRLRSAQFSNRVRGSAFVAL